MENFTMNIPGNMEEVDGFILKHKSPSCGLGSVKIFSGFEGTIGHSGGGELFVEAVMNQHRNLAVEDEGRLKNFSIREHFLTRIFTIAAFRELSVAIEKPAFLLQ